MIVTQMLEQEGCTVSFVFNDHLKELNLLLDGESSHLGVVLTERDGSDSTLTNLDLVSY